MNDFTLVLRSMFIDFPGDFLGVGCLRDMSMRDGQMVFTTDRSLRLSVVLLFELGFSSAEDESS